MTEEKPENPAAFPVSALYKPNTVDFIHGQDGVSLRDRFAGFAMQSLIAHGHTVEGMISVAVLAYAQADAMLAQRVRK
jgi:hypothetical protein